MNYTVTKYDPLKDKSYGNVVDKGSLELHPSLEHDLAMQVISITQPVKFNALRMRLLNHNISTGQLRLILSDLITDKLVTEKMPKDDGTKKKANYIPQNYAIYSLASKK